MRTVHVLIAAACAAMPLAAQEAPPSTPMPEAYRGVQARMLKLQRSLLLAMADSMPESLYRDRATPVQRDFAQQIHHAASAVAGITARYMGTPMPSLPDTASAFGSRAGLTAFINGAFDYAEGGAESPNDGESRGDRELLRADADPAVAGLGRSPPTHTVDRRPDRRQLPQAQYGPARIRILLISVRREK